MSRIAFLINDVHTKSTISANSDVYLCAATRLFVNGCLPDPEVQPIAGYFLALMQRKSKRGHEADHPTTPSRLFRANLHAYRHAFSERTRMLTLYAFSERTQTLTEPPFTGNRPLPSSVSVT